MYNSVLTLTDFILQEERKNAQASGRFTLLLTHIENAAKIIASHVKASGLVDILGKTGSTNTFGEEVQKLDEFSNKLLVDMLINSGTVHALVSEEMPEPVYAPKEHNGDYIVYFDPLDGSSNIDTNCPIGTIFSIYHKDGGLLKEGNKQIAAGYVIYGSSVMFVYTYGNGVNGFTLDPAIGSFLLSHPNMKMPEVGKIYSINEAYESYYDEGTKAYLKHLKGEGKSRARYVGSLVADMHRTFIKGGIFLYPADKKQPEGKLRLTIEVNPFAFLCEQAGGRAVSFGKTNPLTTTPKHIHDRSPIVMGSKENVENYLEYIK
ncbi:MAG: class 1 fructose-bisphosphatase [Patescibacteria group bacterium]|nr:class 1 fructose-bisphosphatase [Patescibacteria group bacterium]MDE2590490.1 class 1 fructose-bisphosphatase [Patescibacteria group bacterium]